MGDNPMLKFVGTGQDYPAKRAADERAHDFAEISKSFLLEKAEEQASRCSQCGVPYCQTHCPLHNNIPDWLRLTAEGRLREAYELSNSHQHHARDLRPHLPAGPAVRRQLRHRVFRPRHRHHRRVEKYITDTAWEGRLGRAARPRRAHRPVGRHHRRGSGGPDDGEYLRARAMRSHVYDRHDRAGGLLTYGIPGFKLEKDVVMRRVQRLKDGGIVFHESFEVGRDATLEQLRERHDAVLIATGVYKARDIKAPGVGASGVVRCARLSHRLQPRGFGDDVPAHSDGSLNAEGKHVVVIGGGDTAMDCVRTAIRQGAKSVKCLYRRDRENMPGSQREVQNAEEEGVEFVWLSAPVGRIRSPRARAGAGQRVHAGGRSRHQGARL
jgi:glutamate synthase (NADPH/NADH) small chain